MTPETPAHGRREARGQRLWAEFPQAQPYSGQTYYGRPAIKPSHYKWLISSYLFTGGLAGASQIIATAADLFGREGDRGVVRAGRYLALLGSLLSPLLLIADLHTPKRFYNMLRIFRPTSPMSIGSWTLAAFGAFSGLTAAGQLLHDIARSRAAGNPRVRGLFRAGALRQGRPSRRRREGQDPLGWSGWLARLASIPATLAGVGMSCYTGSLLAATSVPFWAAVWKWLPPLFGASAMSTAAAATTLAIGWEGAPEEAHIGMERIALVAGAAELALSLGCERCWRAKHLEPMRGNAKYAWLWRVAVLNAGILLPLVIHAIRALTGKRSPWTSKLASAGALAGGFALRAVMTFAGNASAERPEDYFRFTQLGANGPAAA